MADKSGKEKSAHIKDPLTQRVWILLVRADVPQDPQAFHMAQIALHHTFSYHIHLQVLPQALQGIPLAQVQVCEFGVVLGHEEIERRRERTRLDLP